MSYTLQLNTDSLKGTPPQEGSLSYLLEGQQVITVEGYKKIEEIIVGDLVYTQTANYEQIRMVYKDLYQGNLCSIQINGYCNPIKVTEDQPILICRGGKRERNEGIYLWVPAKDIILGDLIVYSCGTSKDSYMDMELAGFLGSYMVFGYIDIRDRVTFCTENSEAIKDYIIRSAEKLNIQLEEFTFNGILYLTTTDTTYNEVCKSFGLKGVRNIPEGLINSNIHFLREFVRAFILSNKDRNTTMFFRATSSLNMLLGYQRILFKLNSFANIHSCLSKDGKFEYYAMVMNRKELDCLGKSAKEVWFRNFHHAFFRVDSIDIAPTVGSTMFALNVGTDNSFCSHLFTLKGK